jgi:hypothetical protein
VVFPVETSAPCLCEGSGFQPYVTVYGNAKPGHVSGRGALEGRHACITADMLLLDFPALQVNIDLEPYKDSLRLIKVDKDRDTFLTALEIPFGILVQ